MHLKNNPNKMDYWIYPVCLSQENYENFRKKTPFITTYITSTFGATFWTNSYFEYLRNTLTNLHIEIDKNNERMLLCI